MHEAFALDAPAPAELKRSKILAPLRALKMPSLLECALAVLSSALLLFAFPDFDLWPLAWVALVPLTLAVLRRPRGSESFILGWLFGTLFFYASCWWLTHAMVHYGGIPRWIAYPLLFPAPLVVGLFPALWTWALARVCSRWGAGRALLFAPLAWAALEWARLGLTGQLWNAAGYSQAYVPTLIQTARWGGVYAVGFLIVAVNVAFAFLILKRNARAAISFAIILTLVSLIVGASYAASLRSHGDSFPMTTAVVVAVQPNVSANFGRSSVETAELVNRHLTMSANAFREWDAHADLLRAQGRWQPRDDEIKRVVVWPESPMNFTYARDARFRETVSRFAREHRTSVLFNSLEPAPAGGSYNSAVLVNEEGRLVAQYDKIRLLPFGEYVPLPRWLPAAWLLSGIVGDFTPGEKYSLMPLGGGDGTDATRIGVFICFESAFPEITRTFARDGADVLVNISNDGYLGRTPVMRQHLANTVFRAVETNRPVLRVTNTGISAYITERGEVRDATEGFEPAVRTWTVTRAAGGKTFYTKRGDVFVMACAAVSLLALLTTFRFNRRAIKH